MNVLKREAGMVKSWLSKLLPSTLTGIDLGSTSIKIVEAVLTPEGPRVKRHALIERGDDPLDLLNSELPARLEKFWGEHGFRKEVCALLPVEQAMVRRFQLPKLPRSELSGALAIEAESRLPTTGQPFVSDFAVLPHRDDDKHDVVLVAAPEWILQELTEFLVNSRLTPVAIDLSLVAAHRALVALEQLDAQLGERTLLADFGATGTRLGMFHGAGLEWIRTLPPLETAEDPSRHQEPSPPADRESEESIFSSITRTLEFHLVETRPEALGSVFVFGGAASDPNFSSRLQDFIKNSLSEGFAGALADFQVRTAWPNIPAADGHASSTALDSRFLCALGASLWNA